MNDDDEDNDYAEDKNEHMAITEEEPLTPAGNPSLVAEVVEKLDRIKTLAYMLPHDASLESLDSILTDVVQQCETIVSVEDLVKSKSTPNGKRKRVCMSPIACTCIF